MYELSPIIGTGPGRGYALLFLLVGILYICVWTINYNNKNLKYLHQYQLSLSKQVLEITKQKLVINYFVGDTRFELVTPCVSSKCSAGLS